VKISELSDDQKSHLAYRLDKYTGYGISFGRLAAEGKVADTVEEVFIKAGKPRQAARYHAKKVAEFVVTPEQRRVMELSIELGVHILQATRGMAPADGIKVMQNVIDGLKSNISLWSVLLPKKEKKHGTREIPENVQPPVE
jgi:hypothetical protein